MRVNLALPVVIVILVVPSFAEAQTVVPCTPTRTTHQRWDMKTRQRPARFRIAEHRSWPSPTS